MPLYLRAQRAGKSPYYEIRGAHLGVKVEESTKTGVKKLALELLRKKREDIERGAVARPGEPTFGEAAERYMTAGGDATYLYDEAKDEVKPLLLHFARTPRPRPGTGMSTRRFRRCSSERALTSR